VKPSIAADALASAAIEEDWFGTFYSASFADSNVKSCKAELAVAITLPGEPKSSVSLHVFHRKSLKVLRCNIINL
jgi:hypothetical protein